MATGTISAESSLRDDVGLDDLRQRVLTLCALGCAIAPYLLLVSQSQENDGDGWATVAAGAMFLMASATFLVARWRTEAGGAVLVASVIGLGTAALWSPGAAWLGTLVPLVVVLASTFGGLVGSLLAAVAVTAVFSLVRFLGAPIGVDELRLILVLTWANVLLVWLASEPTRLALNWCWREFNRAEAEADRARRHQAELGQLVKSLNVAQDSLEVLNLELEQARRSAEEARRLKAEFAAAISHELRTPLNLIIGFSEIMVLAPRNYYGQTLPDTYRDDIGAIYRNASHISNLIDDILDLSQVDAYRMGLTREVAAIAPIVQEAATAVASLFRDKGLTLSLALPTDLPLISLDRTRIRQILINLFSNAVRFTDEGGVTVSATRDERELVISVADTGIGIRPEDLPRVFQEFNQLGPDPRHRYGGSGLGLTVSKRFAELHGGSMWVESKPGIGTTFFFSLPIVDQVVASPHRPDWDARSHAQSSIRPRHTVVVIDEDPEAVRIFERYLDGYQVMGTSTFGEARHAIATRAPVAVIVAGGSSPEDWDQLRSEVHAIDGLPVVTCSLRTVRDTGQELGAAGYVVKPVTRERLSAALGRLHLGRGPRTILIADDDPEMVRLLGAMVGSISARYRTISAYGGAECLRLLSDTTPDAVLLDLLMPGVDGYQVIAEMKADSRLQSVPVILVSAKGITDEVVVARMVGVTRTGGLTVGEAMRCVKSNLDALTTRASAVQSFMPSGSQNRAADGSGQAQPAAPLR